ncbi:disulfide bond formation protein B [Pseudopontixanthobacter vadosimaris]|uniref:disulfide bond formation protein B n=1 Tax=Pseudopontixanthobacter vadosimaris TaxID=2726450 RepID=UPI0014753D39|nr:disulfide bond formation protein B [Pseudopontixanthobacter vadosimaris]
MIDTPSALLARRLAFGVPALALGGAYLAQFGFGLYPCEMCWWQRYPHFAALGLAFVSLVAAPPRLWVAFAGIAIISSGIIGGFHAGVEYGWWEGVTACTGPAAASGSNALDAIMNAPLIRCDMAPWTFAGVSLAGMNFLLSTFGGLWILWLLARRKVLDL